MADSLRDQLLKAGFSSPEPDAERKKRSTRKRGKTSNSGKGGDTARAGQARKTRGGQGSASAGQGQTADAEAQRRKALKIRIKALIENDLVEKYAGETIFRYVLGTRIRELHVTPEIHRQLIDGVLSVTRLNGSTCIVPATTIEAIRQINPDWAIMKPAGDSDADIDGYEQYQVPDDLQW